MVKTQEGEIVICQYCENEDLTVCCVDRHGVIWLECLKCGAKFPAPDDWTNKQ